MATNWLLGSWAQWNVHVPTANGLITNFSAIRFYYIWPGEGFNTTSKRSLPPLSLMSQDHVSESTNNTSKLEIQVTSQKQLMEEMQMNQLQNQSGEFVNLSVIT